MTSAETIQEQLTQVVLPQPNSHKGQNGKLLIIGGSDLFHAASKWSLDVASRLVDMVFYASVPSNNELIKEAKGVFWNGIVIEREQISDYIEEADCVLIGPGMTRSDDTAEITNDLLQKYSSKKWVVDAGALQMVDPKLLTESCIVTPHLKELWSLYHRAHMLYSRKNKDNSWSGEFQGESWSAGKDWLNDAKVAREDIAAWLHHCSKLIQNAAILVKGKNDFFAQFNGNYETSPFSVIAGGNAGMTKGGTGDVLAGLVAGLYATNSQETAALVGSYANKKAGDTLYKKVGPFFNASDLVETIPGVLWEEVADRRGSSHRS